MTPDVRPCIAELEAGWHPAEPEHDADLLRAELEACRAEIARLRAVARAAEDYFREPGSGRCKVVLAALDEWRLGL